MGSKKINFWKWAFFSLAAILTIAGVVAWFMMRSFLTYDQETAFQPRAYQDRSGAEFEIITTKDDINLWIEQEMREEGEDDFTLYLDDAIYVETGIEAFGFRIPVDMTLSPEVTDNGNLIVREEQFRLARFELPSEQVFQLIEATADLPDWIDVLPAERSFFIDLRQASSEEGLDLRILAFDLEEEDLRFMATFTSEDEE
ncbi:YpmS family protein [Salisediminibacterium beveridgei]|uniref:DUF2140 family protein n=1 Tax=Salisediminibacterium beveridgei TaxID=632773 RepID=A0A1D7QTV8_9BACI|nr:YpmS family protein [Salisediminibacterium beveridgei]AOM82456.1 hypothetical protein BBEV_1087 [Salisediminibacterium beveridgei]